jgi:hypothetical protein
MLNVCDPSPIVNGRGLYSVKQDGKLRLEDAVCLLTIEHFLVHFVEILVNAWSEWASQTNLPVN